MRRSVACHAPTTYLQQLASFQHYLTLQKIFLNLIDKGNRIINSLGACGKSVINLLYFFKFTLEFLWKGIIKKDKSCHALFGLGTIANALNIALPAIELLPKENDFVDKFSKIWKSLASNLSLLFWGLRRNKLGNEWLEKDDLRNLALKMQ